MLHTAYSLEGYKKIYFIVRLIHKVQVSQDRAARIGRAITEYETRLKRGTFAFRL